MGIRTIQGLLLILTLLFSFSIKDILDIEWTTEKEWFYALTSLFIAILIATCYRQFATILNTRGCNPKILLRNFHEKIWMTIGLGTFFFSLYLLIHVLGYFFVTRETFIEQMRFGIKHPGVYFILACFIVTCNALLIYIVRMIIKYLYITRMKR